MSGITKSSRVKSQTMGSFSGTSEIVEVKEDYSSSQKSPMFKQGRISSLEDDINKLFEAINIRTSSKGLNQSNQVGSTLLSKRDSKKPMRASTSTSGIGFSKPTSLKQALRGLCISQASEMASMKQLSKMPGSPAVSESGNITSLYRSVVVAAGGSGLPVAEGRVGRLEISLNPEANTSNSLEKVPQYFGELKLKSTNHSANSSPQFAPGMTSKGTVSAFWENETMATSTDVRKQSAEVESVQEDFNMEVVSLPCLMTKDEVFKEGRNMSASIEPIMLEKNSDKNISVPSKVTNKAVLRLRRKGKVQIVPSSSSTISSNKLSKSIKSAPRAIKPSVVRDKSSAKKKTRLVSTSVPNGTITVTDINCDSDPSTSILICKKCQCSLKDPKESDDSSLAAQSSVISLGSSLIMSHNTSSKPSSSLNGCAAVGKSYKYRSSREKGEFSQSSSSIGEFSSSTSLSEDSNLSGASFSNRPHMSKDLRWEAIQHVTKRHGFLGLGHFTLLKKLGGGDIGTVYLAELIGTNCQFAIKVMDNEFLAKRKKMPRAQTEREILRILDHPFLPTLYSQFISDNLSCLVMEYCPGGDLHVLRQKQPCRYFVEQAARFYVAEVLLALEYLHMLGIVYRDLKPENIMVQKDGHIMLTDFDLSLRCSVNPMLLKSSSLATEPPRVSGPCAGSGCIDPFCMKPSCQVSCFTPRLGHVSTKTRKTKADLATQTRSLPLLVAEPTDARSNSFVGTHEYLAPEIIKGEGHGSAVDWWTFGVLLYELLYGKTPFKGLGNEETLANVVLQSLVFPDTPIVSFQARDLIRSLLMKEPENRLGFERGAAEIKQHPFFEGLNWALIRCTIPPQIPSSGEIIASYGTGTKYLEYGTSGEHLEFELF